jgi:hypothetical protein
MSLPPPVQRARERLDRALEDACVDLAWLSRLYAGGQPGEMMDDLHARINELRDAMAHEATTDEQQP